MNTDKETDDKVQEWRVVGHAYHKRICEGREAFYAAYCPSFEPPTGCLKTIDDMKAALDKAGITFKNNWKKPELIAHCQMFLPDACIFDVERERFRVKNEGKIELDFKLIKRIEIAAAMIENHPQHRLCFQGGFAEVTIIWRENGVMFKARIDYMKPIADVDLKTFTNKQNKPIDAALYSSMANQKYHIQCVHYMRAGEKAKEFARDGKFHVLSGQTPSSEWMMSLATANERTFFHVWQKKEGAPVARAKEFTRGSMWGCGQASIEHAVELFKLYHSKFGEDMWIDDTPISVYDDNNFPPWAVEI